MPQTSVTSPQAGQCSRLAELTGVGEMGKLIRDYDWSSTPLGSPEQWPESLFVTLGIMIHSGFPMFLFWGADHICFYNDAYRPSLGINGKHPFVLGKRGKDAWPEIWHEIGPMINQVLEGREATWHEDRLLPFYRNNSIEDVYWTFSYSPVFDVDSLPAGVLTVCSETTGKVQYLRMLQESEQRFSNLVRDATMGICVVSGEDMTIKIANRAFKDLLNRAEDDIWGMNLFDVVPQARDHFYPLLEKVRSSGEAFSADEQQYFIEVDGHKREGFVNIVYQPYREVGGQITGVLMLCQVVTAQVLARRKMEQSSIHFRQLALDAPFAMAVFKGPTLMVELANEAAMAVFSLSDNPKGKPLLEVLPDLEGSSFISQLKVVMDNGEKVINREMAVSFRHPPAGSQVYIDIGLQAILDEDGSVLGVLMMAKDVTDRVLAKNRIAESESNLRNIILQSPVAKILLTGPDHTIRLVNHRMLAIWGVEEEQVVNRSVWDALPAARVPGFKDLLNHVYATGETRELFAQPAFIETENGRETRFINWVYQAYLGPEKNITGIMVVAMDVTEQVVARQRIDLAEERARLAIEAAELGLFEGDFLNNIMQGDARFYEIYGFDASASWEDMKATLHPDDIPIRKEALQTALETGVLDYEARYIRNKTDIRWVRGRGKVMYDQDNRPTRIIGVAQDITEQKEFAKALERKVEERTKALEETNALLQQKNAELNQFAYVASHDLQEPLRKVKTFTGLLGNSLGDASDKAKDYIRKIQDSTTRMQTLIYDILQFSQLSSENERFERVDLCAVVKAILSDYDLLIEQKGARVIIGTLPVVEAVPVQMTQLFTNLISNALKFKSDARELVLQVSSAVLSPGELARYPELDPGKKHYRIVVKDTGIGFNQEYEKKIFDIFQRLHNRSKYEGTGIGLALCKKIVIKHGGTIYAEAQPDEGAAFSIILPELQQETPT